MEGSLLHALGVLRACCTLTLINSHIVYSNTRFSGGFRTRTQDWGFGDGKVSHCFRYKLNNVFYSQRTLQHCSRSELIVLLFLVFFVVFHEWLLIFSSLIDHLSSSTAYMHVNFGIAHLNEEHYLKVTLNKWLKVGPLAIFFLTIMLMVTNWPDNSVLFLGHVITRGSFGCATLISMYATSILHELLLVRCQVFQ